jgi:hypothetical protein
MKTLKGVELHGKKMTASRRDSFNLFQRHETEVIIALDEG